MRKFWNKFIAAASVTALLLGSVTGCGASSNADAADSKSGNSVTTITVATKGSPAPYMVVDENNEISGSDIEILKAVFEKLPVLATK